MTYQRAQDWGVVKGDTAEYVDERRLEASNATSVRCTMTDVGAVIDKAAAIGAAAARTSVGHLFGD
jgi:hypothetical protein